MKHFITSLFTFALLVSPGACSEETAPQFRINNERSDKANVQLQTFSGNTININEVQPDQTTAYQASSEGVIVATVVIQNESVSTTASFYAWNNTRSTVVIQAGSTPTLRIDQ